MSKRLLFVFTTFLFLLSFGLPEVYAQSVVVPNANEFVEGDANSNLPFNLVEPIRYHQVYESSQLLPCGKQFRITQINFRIGGEFIQPLVNNVTIPDISIRLSTTQSTAATISNIFADNIGSDVTTVYDGALTVSVPQCTSGPCPFDLSIDLQTPFIYSPGGGNLLLEITKPESPLTNSFDAQTMSQVTARLWNFGNTVDSEMGVRDTSGLVTQFVCEPAPINVPTLSEWVLIAMAGILGIAGFVVLRRKVTVCS